MKTLLLVVASFALAGMPHSSLSILKTGSFIENGKTGYEIIFSEVEAHHRRPHTFDIEIHVSGEGENIGSVRCGHGFVNVRADTNGRVAWLQCRAQAGSRDWAIEVFPAGPGPFELEIVGKHVMGSVVKLK